jgi:hypothetical protein
MGRPIKKVNFGTYAGAIGIRCEAYIGGSNQNDVFIVKQVGSRRYTVQDVSVGASSNTRAKLVAGTPAATGEMRVTGYVAGSGANTNPSTSGGTAKYAAKITQRRFIASDGTRYRWTLVNDSTQDYIELTAI